MSAKPRTQKRRREIAAVITELSSPELELELLRRALSRTFVAIQHQEKALADLHAKYARQRAEIARQATLIEGGES